MNKLYDRYCKIEEIITGAIFVSIVILVFSAAFLRLFDRPLVWANDIAKLLFAWAALLGADVAMRNSRLIGVDFVVKKLPLRTAKLLRIFTFSVIIVFLSSFVYFGVGLSIQSYDRSFQTLSFMSYSAVTVALPVTSVLMILTAGVKIFKLIKYFNDDDYNIYKDSSIKKSTID
ncbi:MAG: TRAP transporter small permease [Spirochaetaceae bacterium]